MVRPLHLACFAVANVWACNALFGVADLSFAEGTANAGGSGGTSEGGGGAGGADTGGGGQGGVAGSPGGGGFGGQAGAGGMGRSCDDQYGQADAYLLCEETASTCEFFTIADGQHCQTICWSLGGECLGAIDNASGCAHQAEVSCTNVFNDVICICSLGCGAGAACPKGATCQSGTCVAD